MSQPCRQEIWRFKVLDLIVLCEDSLLLLEQNSYVGSLGILISLGLEKVVCEIDDLVAVGHFQVLDLIVLFLGVREQTQTY